MEQWIYLAKHLEMDTWSFKKLPLLMNIMDTILVWLFLLQTWNY